MMFNVQVQMVFFCFRHSNRMSLKNIKRRLSQTFRGSRSNGLDDNLTDLADRLTIEEHGGIRETG
jgi:hypothetical protein